MYSKFNIISVVLPILSLIYGMYTKQTDMVLNSLLTIFCIFAIVLINKKFRIFTDGTCFAAVIFILLAVFLGRTLKVYHIISQWDKVLHFTSGFIIASIGGQVYIKLNGNLSNKKLMTWFTVIFAVAAAGVWEFYEFFVDCIAHISAQNGLTDTMLDMIAGTVSALIAVIFSNIKHNTHSE